MRIVYMGTPGFACPALRALHEAGFEIALVVTQPDRLQGRGMHLVAPPVKELALSLGLPVHQPKGVRKAENVAPIVAAKPHAIVVAAYGHILRENLLGLPALGCINIHASLLPRWRGASPIQHAVLAGDRESGITVMQMSAGLDEGDVLAQEALTLAPDETAATLHDRLAQLGAELIVPTLTALQRGEITATPQHEAGVTYAPLIEKRDGLLDFRKSAVALERAVRAYDPWPGAFAFMSGERLRVTKARVETLAAAMGGGVEGAPGVVLRADEKGIAVATGDGAFVVTHAQRDGRKAMSASELLRGYPIAVGARFELPTSELPSVALPA